MKRGFLNSKKLKNTPLYIARSSAVGTAAEPSKVASTPAPSEPAPPRPTTAKVTYRQGGEWSSKLPYRKIKNTELPKGFEELAGILKGVFNAEMMPPEAARITVTVPAQVNGELPNPDGHVQWTTTELTKQRVFNTPGYLRAVSKPKCPSHVIRDTPNMGKGVFATRDVHFGELVFAERPFLVLPRNTSYGNITLPEAIRLNLSEEQLQRLACEDAERHLEALVQRMSESDQKAYKALYNARKGDAGGPLLGILLTNGYKIQKLAHGPDADALGYIGVARDGCYINHSCRPNIRAVWSTKSFSVEFVAYRSIKAGEQLFYSYCSSQASVAERQAELAAYGFVCHCESCDNATPETDRLRKECKARLLEYSALADKWILDPNLPGYSLAPFIALIGAIEKEGLPLTHEFSSAYLVFSKIFKRLGQHEYADWAMAERQQYMGFEDQE